MLYHTKCMNLDTEEKLLTPIQAARHLNVSKQTLVTWDNAGLIPAFKTPGGHRRFRLKDLTARVSNSSLLNKPDLRVSYCYARVSTHSQKEDLERQIAFFKSNYPNHKLITDIGSGLNFKRKGFMSLLEQGIQGNIKQIVVTHKDRLCRFGFELFSEVISKSSNGEILVLNTDPKSPEQRFCDDILSIITVFSSRLYGLRSHSIKRKIKGKTKASQTIRL